MLRGDAGFFCHVNALRAKRTSDKSNLLSSRNLLLTSGAP
jgi:hypothetical protein